MTPQRKHALQWFYDRGEVALFRRDDCPPSDTMRRAMLRDGQLQARSQGDWTLIVYSLTDKGRRMLNGDSA